MSTDADRRGIVGALRDRLLGRGTTAATSASHAGATVAAEAASAPPPHVAPGHVPAENEAAAEPAPEPPPRDEREVALEFWNEKHAHDVANQEAPDPIDYTRHWFLYNHAVSKPLTGDCAKYWLDEIGARWLRPRPERMLALGCGPAFIEEQILERDLAGTIVAYDTSEVAISSARERIAARPFADRMDLRCANVLEAGIPDASFDAVFVEAALHHFTALDETFALMHRVLRPGGLLLFDEYVGPDLQQYPPELEALLTRINGCLAPQLRRDFESGDVRETVEKCPVEIQLQRDPTEGVHASRILPLTYRYFDVVERVDYGGTIMRPLFNRILLNWDFPNDPKDQTIAQLVVLLEQELLRAGAIPTHNVVVVARPRPVPLPPLSDAEVARIAYADWPGPARAR